jgi:tRNA threonylcarbamoyladenosine biosynthesis protein TsaB
MPRDFFIMPKILAIETSSQACSVALIQCDGENTVITQEYTDTPRSHTKLTLPMVDKVLNDADVVLRGLDAIAFSVGPGSFTGLRIGLGVVQGLAFGAALPVVGVSTLKVLAQGACDRYKMQDHTVLVPCFDARMGENYWGVYKVSSGLVEVCQQDTLSAPEQVAKGFRSDHNVVGVGDGWNVSDIFPLVVDDVYSDLQPDAKSLAKLALMNFNAGNAVPVEQAKLVYLRDTVAWRKRQRLREQV